MNRLFSLFGFCSMLKFYQNIQWFEAAVTIVKEIDMRVQFNIIATCCLLVLCSNATANELAISSCSTFEKPNVLFVILDDFGWKDAGFMGSDFYETPNIDRLAGNSMVFSNAYAGAANCAPSRACLMSGQYSPRHKIFNVGTRPRGKKKHRRLNHVPGVDVLEPTIKTWPQLYQAAGYRTGTFGKWHLSADPIPYGFDVNVGGSHSGSPPKGYYAPHPNAPGLEAVPDDEYLTSRIAHEAESFIVANKDQPWLCYLTHFAVHSPIQANKTLLEKYNSKPAGELHGNIKMATMIESVDNGLGKILATLDRLGLAEKTIIIFTSDNGGLGGVTDMKPLKGYKGCFYEGGIRVPFFVHWPGLTNNASTCEEPITSVDLYPTLCEIAGIDLPDDQILDGESLVPILKNEAQSLSKTETPRSIYWHFPAYLESNRKEFSEQRDPLFRTRPCSIVRKGDWKLHQYLESGELELYNLRADIGEQEELSETHPEKTAELLADLTSWKKAVDAPDPVSNPDFEEAVESEAIEAKLQLK